MIADSSGAGQFRGGCGMRKDVELLAANATAVLLGDRHKNAPYGLFGGQSGSLAQTVLQRGNQEIQLGSKEVLDLQQGDVISFRLAGAGGYGDPARRDPEAVRADVVDGYISRETARAVYGVHIVAQA
jgi:N-methylhydantoinase B